VKTIGSLTLNLAALTTCSSPIELNLQIEPIPGIQINVLVAPSDQFGVETVDHQSIGSLENDSKEQQSPTGHNTMTSQESDVIETLQVRDLEISALVLTFLALSSHLSLSSSESHQSHSSNSNESFGRKESESDQ
jgi:hypothetical protein